MPHWSQSRPALAISIVLQGLLVSCAADARVGRLERRVDSLAVTLTALMRERQAAVAPSPAESVAVTLDGAAVGGDPHAAVALIEFTDYQCPFCGRHFQTTFPRLWRDYVQTGKVRYLIRDMPLSQIHPHALAAARAARCAGAQGTEQFWRYHDALFSHQSGIADSIFPILAHEAGLDLQKFWICIGSSSVTRLVERDLAEAGRLRLSGTPAFIIGLPDNSQTMKGVLLPGAFPYESFQEVIDSALHVAARKGR